MKKITIIIILSAFFIADALAIEPEYNIFAGFPKHEVRAVWLTTIGGLDWPHSYSQSRFSAEKQQKELCSILDKLKALNINTVLLQTRIRGTVIYPSEIEPYDGCLSGFPGKSPGYDALQFAIDECHKRGMELHAWIVAIPVGKWNFLGCKTLRKKYPRLIKDIDDEGYMNPESPVTADYISKICYEIANNYDIDGIHLDYIRYPETWKIRVSLDEGRDNITRIVRKVHDSVKAIKPWIKISCSPVGKFSDLTRYWSHGWNAYNTVCQDAQKWLKDGLMDELFPMMYFKGDQFYPFAIDWKEQADGKTIAPGLGIYFLDSSQKNWSLDIISREMSVLREFNMGHAFFRSKFLLDNTKEIYDFTKDFNFFPAMVPQMSWYKTPQPTSPYNLKIKKNQGGDVLSWDEPASTIKSCRMIYYNVYASDTYPVDTADARNLIATRIPYSKIIIPTGNKTLNYAITSIDRYGKESTPIRSQCNEITDQNNNIIKTDGKTLYIPQQKSTLDADMVTIVSLEGQIIATRQYTTNINISNIPDGIYILKSLNKKGITHRLATFYIKR